MTLSRVAGWLAVVAGVGVFASAATAGIHLSVGPSIEYTDNALKSDGNEISENRYLLNAQLGADIETATLKLDGSYDLRRAYYSEDTQDDQNSIRGQMSLSWEQIAKFLTWDLSNSRSRVLKSNAGSTSDANSEDRSISAIAASFRTGSPVDYFTLTPRYTNITHQDSEQSDTTKKAIVASFTHAFSPLTKVSLSLQQEDVDSDAAAISADYEKTGYSVLLSRNLRRISYNISFGSSEIERRGIPDFESDNWAINVAYNEGAQRFNVAASQTVTDTSSGDGNLRVSGVSLNDAGELQLDISRDPGVADIVVLKRYGIDWQDEGLCTACTLGFSVDIDNSEFVSRNETDEEIVAKWNFKRRVSRNSSFGFLVSPSKVDFSGARNASDYKSLLWRASADRKLSDDVSVYMRIQREERDGVIVDFEENSAVVGFNLQILK